MLRYKRLLLCAVCAVLCACPGEPSVELVSAEYVDSTVIKITLFVRDGSVSYEVSDKTLSVYSTKHDLYYRITGTEKLSGVEYLCTLRREIKPGDRVRVNGHDTLSGSVYFDAPPPEEE